MTYLFEHRIVGDGPESHAIYAEKLKSANGGPLPVICLTSAYGSAHLGEIAANTFMDRFVTELKTIEKLSAKDFCDSFVRSAGEVNKLVAKVTRSLALPATVSAATVAVTEKTAVICSMGAIVAISCSELEGTNFICGGEYSAIGAEADNAPQILRNAAGSETFSCAVQKADMEHVSAIYLLSPGFHGHETGIKKAVHEMMGGGNRIENLASYITKTRGKACSDAILGIKQNRR